VIFFLEIYCFLDNQDDLDVYYEDEHFFGYYEVRCDYGNLNPRKFFTIDTVIVCAEIRYLVDFSEYAITSDLDFRRELWSNRASALNDCVLKIGEKEIKVSSV
jgi:hypothetical protein